MAECSKASAVSKVTVTDAVNFVYSANCGGVRGSLARKGGRGPTPTDATCNLRLSGWWWGRIWSTSYVWKDNIKYKLAKEIHFPPFDEWRREGMNLAPGWTII